MFLSDTKLLISEPQEKDSCEVNMSTFVPERVAGWFEFRYPKTKDVKKEVQSSISAIDQLYL